MHIQWGKKVWSLPPIVQVGTLKKMREACNFHHSYALTMRDKMREKKSKNNSLIFNELIGKFVSKISIVGLYMAIIYKQARFLTLTDL